MIIAIFISQWKALGNAGLPFKKRIRQTFVLGGEALKRGFFEIFLFGGLNEIDEAPKLVVTGLCPVYSGFRCLEASKAETFGLKPTESRKNTWNPPKKVESNSLKHTPPI